MTTALRLGLIGDTIGPSRAPRLHQLAGDQAGIAVRYDRLVPAQLGQTFEQIMRQCQTDGYRGINVTYPYKERVVAMLRIDDPLVRAIGAANTVIFGTTKPVGHNTDYAGFMDAYRQARPDTPTGPVVMIGTGGVGRAVGFGLAALGTTTLRLVDRDRSKAETLGKAIQSAAPQMQISIWDEAKDAASGVAGLINCTPLGMVGNTESVLPKGAMAGAEWAFDAVYTPTDTPFLTDAAATGLAVISGWELFFYQGVHAWALFGQTPLDEAKLRHDLLHSADVT